MSANTYLPPSPVVPGMLLITAISRAYPMVVTIVNSLYNTYVVDQLVCLTVPPAYGMYQANELTAKIIDINGTQFSLNVNSSAFDAFVVPSGITISQPASLAPAGSRNLDNIFNEAFHSYNGNTGN